MKQNRVYGAPGDRRSGKWPDKKTPGAWSPELFLHPPFRPNAGRDAATCGGQMTAFFRWPLQAMVFKKCSLAVQPSTAPLARSAIHPGRPLTQEGCTTNAMASSRA